MKHLRLYLLFSLVILTACSRSLGRIEPVVATNMLGAWVRQQLTASTNCAEVGQEVVFTATLTNATTTPLTILEQPPLDIVIRPFAGRAGVTRWSATDQYPKDINPVLAAGETRTYTWRWVADAAYTSASTFENGIQVEMPVTVRRPGGSAEKAPLSPMIVGVKFNPMLGGRGAFCADLRR